MTPDYQKAAIKATETLIQYVMNLFEYQKYASLKDGSALADLGAYMDYYEE